MSVPTEHLFGSLRLDQGHVVLSMSGEIDLATLDRFRALVDASVAVEPSQVTLDLAGVDYVGLCAIPILEGAARQLAARGGRFTLRNASPSARRLLDVSGLVDTLHIEEAASDASVVRRLAASGGSLLHRRVLDAALRLVVTMAQAVVTGADGVSITLPRHGKLGTVAASNDVVLEMDHDQYDTGQGPCLEAAQHGKRFQITALAAERRWPEFVPRARARGIESILSTPLMSAGQPIGALNIYSRASDAFASHERDWADQFAAEAATVVLSAVDGGPDAADQAALLDALESRHSIAMAQGMLMERHGSSPSQAYSDLTKASRESSQPLRQICEVLVTGTTGSTASAPDGGARVD